MAGALGFALAGPRRYGGVLVEDAEMGQGGRRELGPADIRRALRLYWIADAPARGAAGGWRWASSGYSEQRVEVEMRLEVAGEGVQRRLDAGLVGEAGRGAAEPGEPGGALGVVGEEAVDVGALHQAVGRSGAVGAAVGEGGEGARRSRGRGCAPMCISKPRKGWPSAGGACDGDEALSRR